MIAHHLKFAWRHLRHNRLFSILNLLGLSTGFAAAILIFLWVQDELRTDHYFSNDDQLLQVMNNNQEKNSIRTGDDNSIVLGDALVRELPEVTAAVTTTHHTWFAQMNINSGRTALKARGNFASADYFKVFPYRLLQGHPGRLLLHKDEVVISATLANHLFGGTEGVVGKTIQWQFWNLDRHAVVTGVYEDPPANASLPFQFILSMATWAEIMPANGIPDINGGPFNTYITVQKGTDLSRLNAKLKNFIRQKFPVSNLELFARRYFDQYLYSKYEHGRLAGGRIEYVRLFSLIAILILVIACINFMNLATAKASKRIRETGIKKTLGVSRASLIITFISESLLMSVFALLIPVLIVALVLPEFNHLTGKQMLFGVNWVIPVMTLCTGLLAGSYPAFYISRFKPALHLTKAAGIRKGLVVFQFTLSIVFIIAVMVVHNQLKYIQHTHLGFNKDHVIYFEMEGKTAAHAEVFMDGIRQVPGVVQASGMMTNIFGGEPVSAVAWDDKDFGEVRFVVQRVHYRLPETLGMEIVRGRSFLKDDSSAVIINEAAANAMGLSEPVGKTIDVWDQKKQIVGVVRNFHNSSLHTAVQPFVFQLEPQAVTLFMVRIDAAHQQSVLQAIQRYYKRFNPGFAWRYKFLDEDYQAQYTAEKLVATLSKYFATLTIIISCLGLFGLAAFTAEHRQKEIGIRKVLGATAANIAALLSKEFLWLIAIAMLLACPLAWYFMQQWLQQFAYRIHLSVDVFLMAAASIFSVAQLTISFQALRAAISNPVITLRKEG